ncbi:YqaJ viral recombinase family protein [Trinickia mobilis]|uniref:YqaJ viral recombinase family protein n=1 Tax=Trinickia mobilis TaxID=2816356 RepID=UPI001A8FAD01|nr:YqaJ viral recombinase family protein [Trinickia mobilis]
MTERITHDLVQGTPEWLEFRLTHFGASEAAAMLGLSPKVKRNELLHMKFTCQPKEFSDWVQEHILDEGHRLEALARPIVEQQIGEDLYPVTCSLGILSASCDGLTMGESDAWEHKQYNEALYESIEFGELPEEHMPQAQQILMVTGADRLKFTCSDGTPDKMVHLEVLPDPEWFERLRAGWAQFEKDLAAYEPRELKEKPQAEAIMGLPTLAVQIKGEVVASNLPRFKAAADVFIAGIKTDLKTDQDFADAEETIKFCDKAETQIDLAQSAAISQTASIDDLMKTLGHIREQLRRKRLDLTGTVKKRKEEIKTEILLDGRRQFADHIKAINLELVDVCTVDVRVNVAEPDFAGAIKGKRTLASLHEAVDTALANGKIAADAAARELRAKLDWYVKNADSFDFLFRDLQTVIQKPADDFKLVVTTRIDQHKQKEAERKAREDAASAAAAEAAAKAAATQAAPAAEAQPAAPVASAAPSATPGAGEAHRPAATQAAPAAGGGLRIPRPTAAQIIDILAEHYGTTSQQVAALLSTMDFKAELDRLEATA